ncbi:Hsp33 family molecular chaperone HslO [Anaeromyxobacter diazotrophicus]|uniref:33 kDa chaperonin n=1 Tax=Anaeromyxobacter diazotrophicus TaxID=2590199 RepID=A0A7I9VPW6_9BACT|nr:Hsp33 family molecular chaperone HslO [Anaeromyxobacter diazotrophicus]GEJ58452.1 33 kDa chaperonin [Anaeromyxobacter diazotrophicus]
MSDRLVRGLLPSQGLRVLYARVTDTARIARMLHGLYPTAAYLFGEGLAAGLLVASLAKDHTRVNLQLECDGPLRGLFVDADTDANVRGYVRAPQVNFPGDPAAGARAALGGSGYLSVMRDLGGGQFYRGQVALEARELGRDLERYFLDSEQVGTALDLAVVPRADEPLGEVAGLLVQRLPDGDGAALERIRERLRAGALRAALARAAAAQEAIGEVVGTGFDLLADLEVAYRCGCSMERARVAVSALGKDGLLDVLEKEGEAVVTCEFCRERYVVGQAELRDMLARLERQEKGDGT